MTLPVALLQAVAAPGGGKITLVVGAGCSLEEPTGIPLAGKCSVESHDRLVADGVIAADECSEPNNLSKLADLIKEKTGSQHLLVDQLSLHYSLKTASPNEGHKLAIALLCEGAINSILTLNFDLAFSTAVGELGVGQEVGIIDGPADFAKQKAANIFYLHRNANETDAESWVLRTEALEHEWKDGWEAVVAAKLMASPVVVFVGLGSPADVLVESSRRIRTAVPTANKTYQVDPGDFGASPFAQALDIAAEDFIKLGWSAFMLELSQRVVKAQITQLKAEADRLVTQNGLTEENLVGAFERLEKIGLLEMGKLRASWSLHPKLYLPDHSGQRGLLADVLLAMAYVARHLVSQAIIFSNGIVELQKDGRILAPVVFASGSGTRNAASVEAEIVVKLRQLRGLTTIPTAAVATGVTSQVPISPPADVVLDDQSKSIVFGGAQLKVYLADSLRANPGEITELIA